MFSFFRKTLSTVSRRFPPRRRHLPCLPSPPHRNPPRFPKALRHARFERKVFFKINNIYSRLSLNEESLNTRIENTIEHCPSKNVKEVRTEDLTPARKTLLDRYSILQGYYNLVKSGISASDFAEKVGKDGVQETFESWYWNSKNPEEKSLDELAQLNLRFANFENVSKDRHDELKTLLQQTRSKSTGLTRSKYIGDEGEGDTTDGEDAGSEATSPIGGVGISRIASRVVAFIVSWFSSWASGT